MSQLKDFQVIKKIGDGAFSSVHEVKRISDKAVYALKKVKLGKLSEKEKQNALNEIRILASINHPNVIGYKDAFFDNKEGCLCIIMELANGGDLLQAIEQHKKQKTKFTEKQIWHFLIQTVRGLKALHDLKIVHRDIKCANLFMTKEGMIKLGDLNVSKVAKKGLLQTQTGTPYYASPEVWKEQPYDHKSDIWSLGCVIYEMITLLPPFRAQSMQGLAGKVMSGRYDRIPQHFSNDLNQMVKSCLQVSPKNRPTCDKILATPGLLNHVTGTLEDLDINPEDSEEPDNLLKTIRCPRNLGQISDRLPAAQYRKKIKRCNSMAIESSKQSQLEIDDVTRSSMNQLVKANKDSLLQVPGERRSQISRVHCNLPTIEEDYIDDDTVEVLSALEKQVSHNQQKILVQLKQNIQLQPYVANDKQKFESKGGNNVPKSDGPNVRLSNQKVKPPLAGANPRSADYYIQKGKAMLMNQVPLPSYKQRVGHQKNSYPSDNDDTSTRVSSKSQVQRNHHYHKNQNLDYCMPTHDSQTPAHLSNKLDLLNRRPESHIYNPITYSNPAQLPHIPHNLNQHSSRLSSVQLERIEATEQKLASLHYLSPPSHESYSARGNSRYHSHNRNESLGVSRALGIGPSRYEGVGNAIRLARAASLEGIPKSYHQQPKQQQQYQPRGPCPQNFKSRMAVNNGYLQQDVERPAALNRYITDQQVARGLPDINSSRRQVNHSLGGQSAEYERRHYHYNAPQVANSRFKQY